MVVGLAGVPFRGRTSVVFVSSFGNGYYNGEWMGLNVIGLYD